MPDIKVMIDGGAATPAAPIGPALGPLGVNILEIVNEINEKTKAFKGTKVPVTISIDSKKNVEITVGSPPTSALIVKEAKAAKGSANAKTDNMGNLTIEGLKKIIDMKMESIGSTNKRTAAKEICGTCKSMGIKVDGKDPRDFIKEIADGKHDSELN